jgi:hypothetical protein
VAATAVTGHASRSANLLLVYGPLSRATPLTPAVACAAPTTDCTYSGPAQPATWVYVYDTYFAPGTMGHCQAQGCHASGTGARSFGDTRSALYDAFASRGLIVPGSPASASPLLDPSRSRLSWVNPGGNMPSGDLRTPCDLGSLAAVAAMRGWLDAGGARE